MRFVIYLNYDPSHPIGFVDINEGIRKEVVNEGAIVPELRKAGDEHPFQLVAFGLVPRTEVDTRPREL